MKSLKIGTEYSISHYVRYVFLWLIFIVSIQGFSQSSPSVSGKVDTTSIKIGEQLKYTIIVEADSTSQVIFPEGQTFSPLETVEALKADTTRKKNRFFLEKSYMLTQFDSGAYNIPTQRIEIDGKGFFTDSLTILVADVPVDTLTQKMYDIKPLINIEKSSGAFWLFFFAILFGILLIGALVYWFFFRNKPLTQEDKEALLPPYDRALLELKRLENSKYLIQAEHKKYYSELTDIVRSYLEEDAHITALESTTSQLIEKLEMLKDAGDLKLEEATIYQFQKILQTADLVKFAKSRPSNKVAEEDRKSVEEIVIKTKEAIPEPTEAELMQQETYKEQIAQTKKRKKVRVTIAAGVGVIILSSVAFVFYYGTSYVWDTFTRHPTKVLLEGEWVTSAYGYPPIQLQTPDVLLRQKIKLTSEMQADIKEVQSFEYESPRGLFSIKTTSLTLNAADKESPYQESIDGLLKKMEKDGAKNIITKQEEFITLSGVKGVKIYGSGKFPEMNSKELVKGNYAILLFGGNGFQQQIYLQWLDSDAYAKQIAERVLRTLEVKTEV